MGNNLIVFEQPAWWLFVAATLATIFSAISYFKVKYPWSSGFSLFLAVLRFIGSFLLMVLLMEPLLRQIVNRDELPRLAVVYDDSESMKTMTDSASLKVVEDKLKATFSTLQNQDIQVDFQALSGAQNIDQINYTVGLTDISTQLKSVADKFEGQNLAGILLVSDGIYNRGVSPTYFRYARPIISLALGDTIPPKDLSISNIKINQIAYQGNKFPMEVLVDNNGYSPSDITVSVLKGGAVIERRRLDPSGKMIFELEAENPGLNRYSVSLTEMPEETTYENNRQSVYIDVVEGRERILLVAAAPHPDLAAIRKALAKSDNYETKIFIPTISDSNPTGEYDVVIEQGAFSNVFPKIEIDPNAARWYLLNNRSQIGALPSNTGVTIAAQGNQRDNVAGAVNTLFSSFQLGSLESDIFSDFTPVSVPFGEYAITGQVQTLLYQQIGSVVTSRPLLSVFDDGTKKSALLMGEGIWKWRMLEGMESGESKAFDELVNKLIQYLSVKSDKRKFRFKPLASEFQENEPVQFTAELYNDIYERVYEKKIDLEVSDESGNSQKFEYFPQPGGGGLDIGVLEEGIYQYVARTNNGKDNFSSSGEFLVEAVNLESLNLTADHDLMRELAYSSGGSFITYNTLDQLDKSIEELNPRTIIRSNESFFPWIRNVWVLILIATLFSVEWFLRKFYGAY